ncbi:MULTISPECIES: NupC/NupG family nucleoside CNT transporter [Haemophilus]|jgi:CNT family concentrative nucleoside transporter|uniref:NupC/NupG family nucleoside CNT transporter n=1 Tax=Haemophilus TaxID=724 RepID=UPI0015AA652B|nr:MULTISPECIES: NupC/NupG family nucleoside CNT transporter [Haemophilus]MBF1220099.1 NupC/NupG family nucleoside CNT transporter [Haemophilus parainfluenzae]MBS7064395.1 NupC/NupG family nucleoside CNT transporter [Haemophilus parainfluenzae]MDU4783274.1 NupC/NupG family nucleoside CNT transporter [Haemophilus parainfluenzae]MDU7656141.1 NupC/NupG family nucleoside CNT transporter [Haemophilus parainfluenzae]QOR12311.1 NupC/NupG family nucleoside CNT transporter [Haemophilus parainfluenzae]
MGILGSVLGIVVLLVIAVLFSNNRKAINLRTVLGALAIQIGFAALILYVPFGRDALQATANGVSNVIAYGNEGINFVFGGLSDPSNAGFIFAVKVLPIIVFFSGLISVLYYLGIMQVVIKVIGGALQAALGTSKAESMSAAANIFVGQTEAPLVVRPYIKNMTQSELFAIMAGGTASIAGSVMAGYAGMGVPLTYLIAASFMAAPAGLLFAKILFPQTEQFTDKQPETDDSEKPTNVLEAMAGGASAGMQLALNVGAMLLAFVGLIALINGILGGVGGWFGYGDLTLQSIFGWIFKPLAYLIGVSWDESAIAGQMIGMKLAVNEFVGYLEFAKYLQPDTAVVLSEKTKAIITFALCGFANFSSIAILIGGIGGMAPNRRGDVARLGLKAVVAGTLANLMSATIAGLFIELSGVAM